MSSLKSDILTVVRLLRMHPTELVGMMRERTYREVQDACIELMTDGHIILSSDRYWEIPSKAVDPKEF